MNKKFITIALACVFSILLLMGVSADTDKSYVYDNTGRITEEEKAKINEQAEEIIEKYDIAPYFVVENDIGNTPLVQYTEDFYEEHASGTNCLIFTLTSDQFYVLPIGTAVDIFEYYEDYIYDAFYNPVYNGGTYFDGALSYLEMVEEEIIEYNSKQVLNSTQSTDNLAGKRVVDNADIVEAIDESTLSNKLDSISTKYECDVIVLTVPSTYGTNVTAYADDYYDFNGYGFGSDYDGILFLVSMDEREWAFSTCGNAINIFNDDVLAYMEDECISYLSKGKYYEAFLKYATTCEQMLIDAESGTIHTKSSLPKESINIKTVIWVIAIGLLIAVVVTSVLKGQLKSVKKKTGANDYMKSGSLKLTKSHEHFLYSHVSKRAKPKSSSSGGGTHRSSSGRSHGGRSGRF